MDVPPAAMVAAAVVAAAMVVAAMVVAAKVVAAKNDLSSGLQRCPVPGVHHETPWTDHEPHRDPLTTIQVPRAPSTPPLRGSLHELDGHSEHHMAREPTTHCSLPAAHCTQPTAHSPHSSARRGQQPTKQPPLRLRRQERGLFPSQRMNDLQFVTHPGADACA
ncbi:uncharacterized protein VDAG_01505 [Verticillium dahliae VdLs.17]|uniref:Uncharacterized protein n=1 Tax=Verticillium dahliae (strain VdLs.17 / ATCC MYA-4575 / FGSC 10137) TaxID=498257 RepID=G2WUN2_VERDV|nr:uncharacterized protein VDAG_01505 [Verticillium dahliae VdLs.17]EGY17823.1 hypothetical protein VDAG_01505 [Verticillium dahliae VdLs.17]